MLSRHFDYNAKGGTGVFVSFGDEAIAGGLEINEGVEDAALEPPPGEFSEEALDGVEPRRRCWRKVEDKPLVAIEPSPGLWMLTGRRQTGKGRDNIVKYLFLQMSQWGNSYECYASISF